MGLYCAIGERQLMQEYEEKMLNVQQHFGKLELVDRTIFYISFNTRDN